MRCAFVSTPDSVSNSLFTRLIKETPTSINWVHVTDKTSANLLRLGRYDIAFFFRWPVIVPKEIYESTKCITFHTSNLPEGRGGSPLQNQVMDGILQSRVNAIKMSEPVDSGDIYLSEPISLQGSATDMWLAISDVVSDMIKRLCNDTSIVAVPQETPTGSQYKRRTNNDLAQVSHDDIVNVLRFIQMLDGPGYPGAHVDVGDFRLTLSRAKLQNDQSVLCDVVIRKNR